jgi:tetratricopeptide (TPR) repeat protein
MNINRLSITASAALILMSGNAFGNTQEEFYKSFKAGQYPKALEALSGMKNGSLATKSYLLGLTYSKMQEYDKAAKNFEIAIREKNNNNDLYYEYGQALYASNELKKAREAFKTSANNKFNRPASLYYVAHISQILEEHDVAKEYFLMTIKDKESDSKMKQISQFQLGETLLAIAREKSAQPEDLHRRVEKYILPMMNSAYNLDKRSSLSADINTRISEVMVEFNLDPNLLANGRRVDPKRYNGYASQKVRYDDNISLVNEENNVQQTKKSSFIFESEAYGVYNFILNKRYIISPEARLTFTQHSDRTESEVYQNDSFVMNFSLKNKYEHKIKDLPASFIFDIDYSKTNKDWQAQKKKEFYAKSTTFTLGESFSYFDFGDTTVKLKRKNYIGASETISNHTTAFSADQTIFLPIQHLIVAMFEVDFIDNFNNSSTNTNTFLFRFDYIIPEIRPTYTLGLALATTMTDTLDQRTTRGTEVSWNPSVDLSKDLSAKSKISINYDFTKSTSNDPNYAYTKGVFTTEYRYSF